MFQVLGQYVLNEASTARRCQHYEELDGRGIKIQKPNYTADENTNPFDSIRLRK